MDDQMLKLTIGIVTTLLTAVATFYFTIRINKIKQERELLKDQTYKYFLPFKFACNEFLNRLIHIEKRVIDPKSVHTSPHFLHSPEEKGKDWFHTDWYNDDLSKGELKPGGYFLVNTIYMNCILYYWMKIILKEYPFLKIKIKKTIREVVEIDSQPIKRCYEDLKQNRKQHYIYWAFLNNNWDTRKTLIYKAIAGIRFSTIMKNGIPYGLQESYGDYIAGENGVINYDQFSDLLIDPESRLKFKQLISFWTNLFDEDGKVNKLKLSKIRSLILVLNWIENIDISSR